LAVGYIRRRRVDVAVEERIEDALPSLGSFDLPFFMEGEALPRRNPGDALDVHAMPVLQERLQPDGDRASGDRAHDPLAFEVLRRVDPGVGPAEEICIYVLPLAEHRERGDFPSRLDGR